MFDRGPVFLCLMLVALQFIPQCKGQSRINPEVRAHLEDKVMKSMSLKELEEMVENDERVLAAPRSKLIILPKNARDDPNQDAFIIQRKPKVSLRKDVAPAGLYRPEKEEGVDDFRRSFDKEFRSPLFNKPFSPRFHFKSTLKFDEDFPSLFSMPDLDAQNSSPVKKFYESVVEKIAEERSPARDPFSILDISASDGIPYYKPRFNYKSYSEDPIEVKLKGKKYWRDGPERRDETVDEKGCRTVVKKIIDPEDRKKSKVAKAKSVIITKECEAPTITAPDAKIPQMETMALGMTRINERQLHFDDNKSTYADSRPIELDIPSAKTRDPLAPDYIDKMLDSHFKSFPSFNNPLSSFRGYQDRFKLQAPSAFKDIKPTINVESYDRSHPQSGFEEEPSGKYERDESVEEAPKSYKHKYLYEYPQESPRKPVEEEKNAPISYVHHHHYDYPKKVSNDDQIEDYGVKKAFPKGEKYSSEKEPKMMKKSYAYYRKDNPKEDPNDQHYAEEYAQGNYRSFSSDYDSERDGPKKD